MVISSLNIKLLEDRLGMINKGLAELKKLSLLSRDDFLTGNNPPAAESYIRRTLEAIFDIGRHIIARTAGKGAIEYKEVARQLGENGVISQGCSMKLILMAGYRNRSTHFYHEVEDRELYTIIKEHLPDVEIFVKEIKKFLESIRCEKN